MRRTVAFALSACSLMALSTAALSQTLQVAYDFTVSNFADGALNGESPPVDSVSGSFGFTFAPSDVLTQYEITPDFVNLSILGVDYTVASTAVQIDDGDVIAITFGGLVEGPTGSAPFTNDFTLVFFIDDAGDLFLPGVIGAFSLRIASSSDFWFAPVADVVVTRKALDPETLRVGEARFNPASGHLYEVVEGTWDEADAQGVAKGGHLVTINDAAEQQWLVDTFDMSFPETTPNGVNTKVAYWIGLNDREVEGQLKWTSGETLAETGFGADLASPPWSPLQPSDDDGGGNSEDLVAVNFRICDYAPTFFGCTDYPQADDPGLWNDFGGAGDFLRYGIIEYPPPQWSMDPRSTFLRIHAEFDSAPPPLVIDLAAQSIAPGQLVRIVSKGDYSAATSGEYAADSFNSTVAVFSSSSTVLAPDLLNRVPGAIDAGTDYTSAPVAGGTIPTDITQDFEVTPEVTLVVPAGAAYLMVGVHDVFYSDNSDPDGDFGVDVIAFPAVSADPSVSIGANPSIGDGTTLDQNAVIGDNVVLGAGVQVSMGSTIGDDVHIGDSTTLNQGSTIGDGSDIGSNVIVGKYVTILENVSIGDGTQIGQGAVICAGAQIGINVVIGKNVLIQTGAVVADGTSFKAQKTAPSPASCNAS